VDSVKDSYKSKKPKVQSVKTEARFISLMASGEISAREVWVELERLREYEWMYEDLQK
jgi:hypothetical protein